MSFKTRNYYFFNSIIFNENRNVTQDFIRKNYFNERSSNKIPLSCKNTTRFQTLIEI